MSLKNAAVAKSTQYPKRLYLAADLRKTTLYLVSLALSMSYGIISYECIALDFSCKIHIHNVALIMFQLTLMDVNDF